MGALTSRQHAGVEVVDISANHAYRYPPKTGCYFGSHFIMGGERFDTTQPEAYLFGENIDLNFLGNRPIPFPYPAPQANEPTKTLKSLVNIRKDSLRFVRAPTESGCGSDENHNSTKYSIEFTFDSDVRCAITIFYFATEEITSSGAVYTSKDPSLTSETFFYKKGASQQFVQSTHVFDPSKYTEDELSYGFDREIIPIVIQCVADEECTDLTWKKTLDKDPKQQHMTFGVVEKNSDGGYTLKPLKQKQFVDGVCYLLQEIYGIENKNAETSKVVNDDEVEDNGSECVICMSDIRDTLILPCRHLCLCNTCADSLRYQANNCPICRAPFRALLQIRALRRKTCHQNNEADDNQSNQNHEHIPHGFEAVSLIEALNGPLTPASHPPQSVATQMPPDDMNSPIAPVQSILPPVGSPTLKTLSRHPSLVEARTNVRKSLEGDPVVVALGDAAITMMTETVLSTDLSPKLSPHEHDLGILSQSPLRDGSYESIYRTPQDSITVVNEVLAENDFSQPLLKSGYDSARDSPQDSQVSTTHSCLLDEDERSVTPPLEPSPDYQEDEPAPDYSETPELDDASCVLQDIDVRPDDITSSILYTPEDRAESVPLKNPPSYAEAISLPGTPLIGSSNRSSGESFSSTSSTRMLLSEQKREPLDEDRVIM